MALSFENSIEKFNEKQKTDKSIMPTVLMAKGIDILPEKTIATSVVDENFSRSDKYEWYNNYSDVNFSIIDDNKNITVNEKTVKSDSEVNS